jgi:salicylate hydroxylase
VIIIGAGLGGCAAAMAMHHQGKLSIPKPSLPSSLTDPAGFHVTIFERLRNFQRLGDSLGLGENALRLLARWGLHEQLIHIGNKSPNMQIRRWNDGEILAVQPLMDMAGYIGHRGDYHAEFLTRVQELGMTVRMGHKVHTDSSCILSRS